MEHRRDVRGGDLRTSTASGSSRGHESTGGSQAVWAFARYGTEDARVRGATRLPAAAADQASQVGPWLGVIDAILNDDKLRPSVVSQADRRLLITA